MSGFKGAFSSLQKIGKSLMLPVSVLPVSGILLGVGSAKFTWLPEAVSTVMAQADYAMTDIGFRQLHLQPWFRKWLADHGERIDVARVDGVVFGELWRLDH